MNLAYQSNLSNNSIPENLDILIQELNKYRNQSRGLTLSNQLHKRLAGAVDLSSMIEAFSIWLMPIVGHDLIAYSNTERDRVHMFCSSHGPERRLVMDIAERVINTENNQGSILDLQDNDFIVKTWQIKSPSGDGTIILVRKEREIDQEEQELMTDGLSILHDPLQRSLDYDDLYLQARRDTLTGLANRRVFEERITPLLDSSQRHGHPITLASMDLDNFKQINDNLGHAEGDSALKMVANTLSKMVRSSDLLVRMGGDEFLLVLPDTTLESAQILTSRICAAVGQLDINSGNGHKLGISIGLAEWNSEMSQDEWMQRADETLYQAKSNGRNQVCVDC
jgi:diguanylate cyclase (GGDEF)-like protein